ncbi:MAG: hypothetical protein AB1489_18745 [Acidobacteriota bacterium]
MGTTDQENLKDNPDVAHEHKDINVGGVIKFGISILVSAIFIQVLVWLMFKYFDKARIQELARPVSPLAVERPSQPPTPRLQINPIKDLRNVRAAEEEIINSYGWVDRDKGVVRLPIERAIDLLVERGLPVRTTPAETASPDTNKATMKDSSSGRVVEKGVQ